MEPETINLMLLSKSLLFNTTKSVHCELETTQFDLENMTPFRVPDATLLNLIDILMRSDEIGLLLTFDLRAILIVCFRCFDSKAAL